MTALILATSGQIGVQALYFFLAWLVGAASSNYLSERKGYGPKAGLATGLVLSLVGTVVWLLIPARPNSDWKLKGIVGDDLKHQPTAGA